MLRRETELVDIERRITEARAILAAPGAVAAPSTSPSTSEEPGVDMQPGADVTAVAESRPDPRANGLGRHEQPTVERAVLSPELLPAPENLRTPESSSLPEMHIGIQYQPPPGPGLDEAERGGNDELHDRRRRLFGLRKGRAFVDYAETCAVCGTTLKVERKESLKETGWVVGDGGGLCPDCQTAGWEWPDGAVLPLRRSAAQA
jgi:hypothetical protein